jgi:hypothetical protein
MQLRIAFTHIFHHSAVTPAAGRGCLRQDQELFLVLLTLCAVSALKIAYMKFNCIYLFI